MKKFNQVTLTSILLAVGLLTSYVSNAQTTLTIAGSNNVCVGDVSTYSFSPLVSGAIYTWTVSSQGNVLNSGSSGVIQWINTGSATITVQGLDTSGTSIAEGTLNVTINDIPQPNILPSAYVSCAVLDTIKVDEGFCIQVCENSSVTYSVANEVGATYNWSVIGAQSFTGSGNTCNVVWGDAGFGNVAVEVVQGSCIGTDLICIEIIEKPDALFSSPQQASQQSIDACLNSSILFLDQSSAPTDSPILSWVWDFGDGTGMSIGLGSAGSPIEHSYNQPGTYEVNLVVTNACGCSDKYAMYVNVDEFQGIQIECPAVVCDGDEVEYTVDNPSCSQASWTVDGGQITSQSSQYVKVIWDDVDELGFGDVTYINECEPCAGKTTVKIPVITDNAAIQGPTNVCPNSVYYYSMPQWPSTKFQWSLSGDATFLNSEQPNVLSVLTGNSGSFTIISEPCNGLVDCAARDSITVNISPQAFINGSQESCIDLDSEYTLSNASSATWILTSPSGISTQYNSQASIEPTFTEVGTYSLQITGSFCSPDLFLITVHARPPAPAILGPDSACVGVPAQYSVSPQTAGTTTQWGAFFGTVSPQIGPITTATFSNLNIPYDIYAVNELTNVLGCVSSGVVVDIISASPSTISMTTDAPPSLTVCGSTQWHFDIDYTGGDLYQWKILDPAMGSIVSGNNSPHIEVLFNNPTGPSEDVQVVVAVTKCNQIKRDTLTMHVINPPDYTVTPGEITVCAGEPLNFSLSPTPGEGDISWDFGNGITSPNATPTYAYPNDADIAEYTPLATIVNPEGCPTTVVVQGGPVTVKPAPVAVLSPAGTLIGCGAFSETLYATVSTGFGSTTNFEWHGPTTAPPPPNCASCDTWNINQYGEYYVVVENSNGCEGVSNTVFVNENCSGSDCPGPYQTGSGNAFVDCGVVQATIQYNTNGYSISSETWAFPPQATYVGSTNTTNATATASFAEAGIYPFNYMVDFVGGACTKIFDTEVYVPFVGDMRYTVTCGSGSLYDVTLHDHSNVFPTEEGYIDHSYAYSNNGGSSWNNITASSSALSVDIQLPAGNYIFREIIYSNLTTAAPACTTLVSVNLPDKPDADFEIVSPFEPACINDVVVHFNNLSTPSGLNYLWDFGDGPTNFQDNPDKVYGEAPLLGNFIITLTATNTIGCIDSTQNTIEIQDNGLWDGTKPNLFISPAPPVCMGNPITLAYTNPDFETPTSYTWYEGNTPITPVVTSSSFDVTQEGQYWVMGSDQYGCLVPSNPASIYFTDIQPPTIIGNPAQCDSIPFTLTSSLNSPGITLAWQRSPGGAVGTDVTLAQTLTTGTYIYTLTATQNGCHGVSVPYTVTVASPVDTPAVSFNITNCEPYEVELTATNAQSGTYNWSNGTSGATVNGFTGGLYEVYFTSNSGCTSSNEIMVPKSPQEYIWTFPTGCFCVGDLEEDYTRLCAQQPVIAGPIIPFAYWSYMVNGADVLSGTESVPTGFTGFGPDSVNLILDNGYCHIISDAMYISEDCISPEPEGLISSGSSLIEMDSKAEEFSQNMDLSEPSLLLIPNPAADQTRIQYRFDGSEIQKTIEIYDVTGRKLKTLIPQNNEGSITLQLGDFVGGIYQVCLRQDGRIIAQTKLSVTP